MGYRFLEGALDDWKRFYSENGRRENFGDCDGYRIIVSLGFDSLPFIREVYGRDSAEDRGLVPVKRDLHRAVRDIVGDEFQIPSNILGDEARVSVHTMRWLDDNVVRFSSALGYLTFRV